MPAPDGARAEYRGAEYRDASRLDARVRLHREHGTNPQGWFAWLFERLRLPAQCRVLDAGCGSAGLWVENAARIPPGWDITLADLSPGMLAEARANVRATGRPYTFAVLDVQSLPFATESFDAILANHMLYHVPDRQAAYGEFRRVLRRRGRLYAATNGRFNMRAYVELVERFGARDARPPFFCDVRAEEGFNLEHGGCEISDWLSAVRLHLYEDSLRLTEAAPLAAYAQASSDLRGEALAQFERAVQALIERDGALVIRKDVGLFEARK